MAVPKPSEVVTTVEVNFKHNASRILFELMKKHRLIITTRRYNNRYLVTLRDSYVIRKFRSDKVFAYCDLTGREVEIEVDDIKRIEILN